MNGKTPLQKARLDRGWSQARVANLLNQRAPAHGLAVRPVASRVAELSRWENGRVVPDIPTRSMFREIYGKTDAELGFATVDVQPLAEDDLADRLVIAKRVDAETVEMFKVQVDGVRQIDQKFGAVRLDQLRNSITDVEKLLRFALLREHRQPLAAVLTEASTLAGWIALDAGSVREAWSHYDRARTAAAEAGSNARLAHAVAEQAVVALDLGDTGSALALLGEAQAIAGDRIPRLLRAWLAAMEGEGHAVAGDRDAALRSFDRAYALLPTETSHPELPFLFLAGRHLDRWRGNALVQLGDASAIQQLTAALDFEQRHPSFVRARAKMYVDLAKAHSVAGDRAEALRYVNDARRLINQLGSVRLKRALERVVVPTSRRGT